MTADEDVPDVGSALGPLRVEQLMRAGVAASAHNNSQITGRVLEVLMFEGNRVDLLAFMVGCLVMVADTLPPGVSVRLGAAVASTQVSDGQDLAVHMLDDYLLGNMTAVYDRWLEAEPEVACAAIGAGMRLAGDRLRSTTAALQ